MIMNSFYLLFGFFLISTLFSTNLPYVDAIQAEGKSGWEVMSDKVCGDKLCSEIKSVSENSAFSSIAYFPPPLVQISQGVDPSNVTCTEGKALILKQSNGLPACMNPLSIEKLITRGWVIHVLSNYVGENNNSEIFSLENHLMASEMVTLMILQDTWPNL